ncbi:hypothetical protein DERF_002391 [Dermatophagoides farinae]|uniref:Uncharacterized protein n=1 Tax=Dermatophagoides farinae TaxID=6954 RepID=A0A922IAK3_DERFA|nr:hypothetical protein DERF_002391 [Dermatophagoides farinae]
MAGIGKRARQRATRAFPIKSFMVNESTLLSRLRYGELELPEKKLTHLTNLHHEQYRKIQQEKLKFTLFIYKKKPVYHRFTIKSKNKILNSNYDTGGG